VATFGSWAKDFNREEFVAALRVRPELTEGLRTLAEIPVSS
jgi:hypothetical protein